MSCEQCLVRRRLAKRRVAAIVAEVYRKMFDASSGYMYYFNTRTGASSWHKPLGAVLGDDDLEMTPRTMAAVLQAYPPSSTCCVRGALGGTVARPRYMQLAVRVR